MTAPVRRSHLKVGSDLEFWTSPDALPGTLAGVAVPAGWRGDVSVARYDIDGWSLLKELNRGNW